MPCGSSCRFSFLRHRVFFLHRQTKVRSPQVSHHANERLCVDQVPRMERCNALHQQEAHDNKAFVRESVELRFKVQAKREILRCRIRGTLPQEHERVGRAKFGYIVSTARVGARVRQFPRRLLMRQASRKKRPRSRSSPMESSYHLLLWTATKLPHASIAVVAGSENLGNTEPGPEALDRRDDETEMRRVKVAFAAAERPATQPAERTVRHGFIPPPDVAALVEPPEEAFGHAKVSHRRAPRRDGAAHDL